MDESCLLVVEGVVDVLLYYARVASRVGDVLALHRLQTLRVICQHEDVLALRVQILDAVAGAAGTSHHHSALETAGEGTETDGGEVDDHRVGEFRGEGRRSEDLEGSGERSCDEE